MKDKRKRRNPTIRNAILSCRSRGPDSPKSVAPPGIAAPGPPTILAPAFDGQPQDEALRGKSHGSVGAGVRTPDLRSAQGAPGQAPAEPIGSAAPPGRTPPPAPPK